MKKLLHERLMDWAESDFPSDQARRYCGEDDGRVNGMGRVFKKMADEIERDYISRSEYDAEIKRIVDARGDSGTVEKLSHNVMRLYAMHKGMPMEDGESITDWLGRWFIERPRFEDGEPVQFGDEVFSPAREVIDKPDEHYVVEGMRFYRGFMRFDSAMSQSMNFISVREGERVRRPAPKVYDADGTEIEVGDTVYNIHSGKDAIVEAIFANGRFRWRNRGGGSGAWSPDSVSHQRPVFDAEGERIKVGHTVWDVDSGEKLTVEEFANRERGIVQCSDEDGICEDHDACKLTHERPVFDAEGERIKVGDAMWFVNTGVMIEVTDLDPVRSTQTSVRAMNGCWYESHQLTHREPDSLEKLRDDMLAIHEPVGTITAGKWADRLNALMERGA